MNSEYFTFESDGQHMICPTIEQWGDLHKDPYIDNLEIWGIDQLINRITRNFEYSDIRSCLYVERSMRVKYMEFVHLNNMWVRVFIERVICEKCRRRAKLSATPVVSDLYFGLENPIEVRKKGHSFPNLSCKWCGHEYSRRYTIWQRYE